MAFYDYSRRKPSSCQTFYVSTSSVMTFFATMLPLDEVSSTSESYTASTNTDVKERLGKSWNLSLCVHMQIANTFPLPQISPKSFNINKNNLIKDKM